MPTFNFCARTLTLALALTALSCTQDAPPKNDHNPNAILPSDMQLLKAAPNTQTPITRSSPGAIIEGSQGPNSSPAVVTPPAVAPQVASVMPAPKPVAAAPKTAIPKEDIVVPPPDARYTLFIAGFDGPGHIESAKAARDKLSAVTSSKKFYVIHEDNKSCVYYGFYADIDSASKLSKQARADMEYLKNLKTADGQSPLSMIYFTPVTTATPDAPAEWDLAKIGRSPQHYWSLQIAAYTPDGRAEAPGAVGDRKTAAVESVRALRAAGIEAYFYHGEAVSSVCVGVWPETAVKRQDGGDAAGNAATINPSTPLLVADQLPKNYKDIRTPEGEKVRALTTRLEVLDPGMLATMKQFPTHALNGFEMMRTYGKGANQKTAPDPSVLVLLPETKSAMPGLPTDADMLNLQLNATGGQVSQPGVGRLKSIGE